MHSTHLNGSAAASTWQRMPCKKTLQNPAGQPQPATGNASHARRDHTTNLVNRQLKAPIPGPTAAWLPDSADLLPTPPSVLNCTTRRLNAVVLDTDAAGLWTRSEWTCPPSLLILAAKLQALVHGVKAAPNSGAARLSTWCTCTWRHCRAWSGSLAGLTAAGRSRHPLHHAAGCHCHAAACTEQGCTACTSPAGPLHLSHSIKA